MTAVNAILEWIFGRTPEGDRRVWAHTQNLNEDHRGEVKGSILRAGRAWLHCGRSALCFEWHLWSWRHCCMAFRVSDERIGFHVAIPPVALWWSIERSFSLERRDTSITIHDWQLWWNVWRDDNSWDRSVPRWRCGNWDIRKTLAGDCVYRSEVLSERNVSIPMPEGCYPARVSLTRDTWRRPRWWTRTVYRAEVDMLVPIPHQGKGENSWDCGKDALHGGCFLAKTYEDAIASVVCQVLSARRKYDGDLMASYPPPDWAVDECFRGD